MAHGLVLVRTLETADLVAFPNTVHATDKKAASRIRSFTKGIQHNAMDYGLCRIKALKQANLGSHLGQDYLLCLQMCLLGEVTYVETPTIIVRERDFTPIGSPMYRERPLTIKNVFTGTGLFRWKCCAVLVLGNYYLATKGNLSLAERLDAIGAFTFTFCSRYRSRLAKEVIFLFFAPVAWFYHAVLRRTVRRLPTCLHLMRKLKALLT
jgi:hypothetical protein